MPHNCPDCGHDHDRRPYSPTVFKVHGSRARGANGLCFHHECSNPPLYVADGRNGAPYAICEHHAPTWDENRARICPDWGKATAA